MKAFYTFPFGTLVLSYEGDVLIGLSCRAEPVADEGVRTPFTDRVAQQVTDYLAGKRKVFDFAYRLDGTAFQKQVWAALREIPYGETRTYRDIAEAIGRSKACRAVGLANNKNPILLIVPCHRVIGANGGLVGYAGGLAMKAHLLRLENPSQIIGDGT